MGLCRRIAVLVLSAAVVLGWSPLAAARPEGKKGDGRTAIVQHPSPSAGPSRVRTTKTKAKVAPQPSKAKKKPQATQAPAHSSARVSPSHSQRVQPQASPRAGRRSSAGGSISNVRHTTPRPTRTAVKPRPAPERAALAAQRIPPTVTRGGRSFDQKVVVRDNAVLVQRTPLHSHHHEDGRGWGRDHDHEGRFFHHRRWHHHDYYCYVHYRPYPAWFWGFYFAPFAAPWHYSWVWVGEPWYGVWGWYWAPYPVYVGPSYWVTDYTISRMLADEYERGYVAGQESAGTPISEPVKEQLRVQVEETAKSFEADRPITLEQAIGDPEHLFVVDAPLSVTTADRASCALTGGDVLKASGGTNPDVAVASMTVVTSKREDCAAGSTVSVSFTDLQEMLNSFSATVDDGMQELEKQRGEPTVTAE